MDRSMIDAASGGALVDKTPNAARDLISNMAANSQQYGIRMDHTPKKVNEVSTSNLERQIYDLTTMVRQMAVGNMQAAKVCGICSLSGHNTNMCPKLQEDETVQQANAVGNFPGQPQRRYDPYSNTYNPGWRDHPNLSYEGNKQPMQNAFPNKELGFQQVLQQYPSKQAAPFSSGTSLEDMFKAFMTQTQQFQQETKTSIH